MRRSGLRALLLICVSLRCSAALAQQPQADGIRCVDRSPIQLTRTREDAYFDRAIGNADLVSDSWRMVAFRLERPSQVSVSLRDGQDAERGQLVPPATLGAGDHVFVLSYGQVAELLGSDERFRVVIAATVDGATSRAALDGYLRRVTAGEILSRVMFRDVLIQTGNLQLRREDLEVAGDEPNFAFIRSYRNQPDRFDLDRPLGPGWNHNHDIRLHVVAWGQKSQPFNLPEWVVAARGRFVRGQDVPESDGPPRMVHVQNAGLFKRVDQRWVVQASFHGRLTDVEDGLVFESLDHTHYAFEMPRRPPLALCSADTSRPRTLEPPQPVPVRTIENQGHRLSYRYAQTPSGPLVSEVTDPAGRLFRFRYDPPLDDRKAPRPRRLVQVTGPDGISLDFGYGFSAERMLHRFSRNSFVETYRYELHPREVPAAAASPRPRRQRMTAAIDARGQATRYGYGGRGVAAGMSKVADFDPELAVTSITDPDSARVRFRYGEGERTDVRVTIDESNVSARYVLNATGNPLEIEDPPGSVTYLRWSHDAGLPDIVQIEERTARR